MKVLSIVGARPEFIQANPISRVLRINHRETLVHTGQHYDYRMSQTFFDELGIPAPDYNLEVGSASHALQTAEILTRLDGVLLKENPDLVIVRGDTNSTLAGAVAASKRHIPVAHVEAGERSFDRRMPEEINRIVTDSISDMFFCASQTAVKHLAAEGKSAHVHLVGDVMVDSIYQNLPIARRKSDVLGRLGLKPGAYALATVHRAANTDDPGRLSKIVQALNHAPETVVFPIHPRTQAALQRIDARFKHHVKKVEPVGYLDMMVLEENARIIATDSGGVQREAYIHGIPCLTLRAETEWVETVAAGWNMLVDVEPEQVISAWRTFTPAAQRPAIFGDGKAGERIVSALEVEPVLFGFPQEIHPMKIENLISNGFEVTQ
jgi:UDP-N-acetylglucosamine 2-epimerase